MIGDTMKKKTTGYWLFLCNPNKWQIDRFIESGKTEDTYSVSEHHRNEFEPGQKGIIRVGIDNRTKKVLGGKSRLDPGIYAIVEITSYPQLLSSENGNYWLDSSEVTKQRHRVTLKYVATNLKNPVYLKDLIGTPVELDDPLVIHGYQGSSYPITQATFEYISSKLEQPTIEKTLPSQEIDIIRFENYFSMFSTLVKKNSSTKFTSFTTNKFLQEKEGHKDAIFADANQKLNFKEWTAQEIGTGKIFSMVSSALSACGNLVPWQDVDRFKQLKDETSIIDDLESVFFNLYKNTGSYKKAFENLQNLIPNHYSLIAYFFFIKDKHQFLPISTTKLENGLSLLGIRDFRLTNKCGWDNYMEFILYIKQVKTKLIESGIQKVTLLNAHSFVWIIANIKEEGKDYLQAKNLEDYDKLSQKEQETVIQARIGQGVYRKNLMRYWKTCSVTGCENPKMLTASHMKPWKACSVAEVRDPNNGLLLIPNLDKAFDQGLISFTDEGAILLSSLLDTKDQTVLGITKEMKLRKIPTEGQKTYLAYHRREIFRR